MQPGIILQVCPAWQQIGPHETWQLETVQVTSSGYKDAPVLQVGIFPHEKRLHSGVPMRPFVQTEFVPEGQTTVGALPLQVGVWFDYAGIKLCSIKTLSVKIKITICLIKLTASFFLYTVSPALFLLNIFD